VIFQSVPVFGLDLYLFDIRGILVFPCGEVVDDGFERQADLRDRRAPVENRLVIELCVFLRLLGIQYAR
jgi:hypothetical protein